MGKSHESIGPSVFWTWTSKETYNHFPMEQKNKYDWEALKQEYILSEIQTVSAFFRQKWGSKKGLNNSNFLLHTKGWPEAKAQFKKDITDAVINEAVKDRAAIISEAEDNALTIVSGQLKALVKIERLSKHDIHPKALKPLWEMARTEAGKPTHITKQEIVPVAEDEEALMESIIQDDEKATKSAAGKRRKEKGRRHAVHEIAQKN